MAGQHAMQQECRQSADKSVGVKMGPFEVAPAVVFIVMLAVIVLRLIRSRERVALARANGSAVDSKANDRIKALEDRVKVLERIVTDGSARLAREIDAL